MLKTYSALLKSQYLSMVASMKSRPVVLNTNAASGTHGGELKYQNSGKN